MSNTIKHSFTSAKADDVDSTLIQPSHWNSEHTFAGGSANGDALVWASANSDKVQFRNPGWIDVRNYGAVGDGSTDDTSAIQSAITAAIAIGGTVYVPHGTYKITSTLTLTGQCSIVGESISEVMGSIISDTTALNAPPAAPYLLGSVILQATAATDAFALSGGGATIHVRNLGVRFAAAIHFQNTGHGFNMTASGSAPSGGTDSGLVWSRWDNVVVFGHDGSHYAFQITNGMLNTFSHLRSYGGGGFRFHCDSFYGNYGNSIVVHPYAAILAGTTADGFRLTSRQNGATGRLNYVEFHRPQSVMLTLGVPKYGATLPVNTQSLFYVDDSTVGVSVTAGDFETAIAGATIRLPTSLPMYFDPSSVFPAPSAPIPLVRAGTDGTNRALYSDMSLGRYASQALLNKFAGAALGTSPPAVLDDGSSDDWRGTITFGSGTSPTTGSCVDLRFFKNRGQNLYPVITAMNAATAALGLYVSTISQAQLVISCQVAPAASQANTTYKFTYQVTR